MSDVKLTLKNFFDKHWRDPTITVFFKLIDHLKVILARTTITCCLFSFQKVIPLVEKVATYSDPGNQEQSACRIAVLCFAQQIWSTFLHVPLNNFIQWALFIVDDC